MMLHRRHGALILFPLSLLFLMLACNFPSRASPTAIPPTSSAEMPPTQLVETASPTFAPPEETPPPATLTPTPTLLTISGVLWHEICEFSGGQAGEPVVLGVGCVQYGAEDWEFGPNQIYDPFETGWDGVTLHLGAGPCPSTGLATTLTNAQGEYAFDGLSAGAYCVSYNNLTDGNDTLLIPGGPTYPFRDDSGFYQNVELLADENQANVDFGYAFQFYN